MASQYPPKSILVVDDNRDAADLTAQLLCMYGQVASVAYGGREGIDAAVHMIPDVILIDLSMPDVDGYAVAAALRLLPALDRSLLIAYTAWNDAATRSRALASGFDHHMVKPSRLEDILSTVSGITRLN